MSCNCLTTQQLNELYKRYGYKVKLSKNESFINIIKFYTTNVLIAILMCVIAPILFIYISYVTIFGDGKISFKKFFNLKENNIIDYVRKQQNIQNKNKNKLKR